MRGACLVLLLVSVGVEGQDKVQDRVSKPLTPSPKYRQDAPAIVKVNVHPIPLSPSYARYVHLIPLCKSSDHYVREISTGVRDETGAKKLVK
jgi:hypothetical protein